MTNLHTILTGFEMPIGKAALIAILGLAIIFAVLAVLVGLLTLFKLVFSIKITKARDKSLNIAEDHKKVAEEDDSEIAAAIAAVMAYMNSDETATAPFRVTDIRKLK